MDVYINNESFLDALRSFAVDYCEPKTVRIPDYRQCPYVVERHHEYVAGAHTNPNAAMALVYSYISSIASTRSSTWKGQDAKELSKSCAQYLDIACKFNHTHANCIVGRVYAQYLRVQGINHNDIAIKYFEAAAIQGAKDAVALCCNYYSMKKTITNKNSYYILLMGINYKIPNASKTLGIILYHGIEGVVERNRDQAFKYFNNLTTKDSEVMTYLSFMHMHGHGVAINPEQSAKMIIEMAEINDLKALDLLRDQAERSSRAAFVLGLIYQRGFFNRNGGSALEVNEPYAMKWFTHAHLLDPLNSFAARAIDQTLAKDEDLVDITINQLLENLQKLVNKEKYDFYSKELERLTFIKDFEGIMTLEYFKVISPLLKGEPSAIIQNILRILDKKKLEAESMYDDALQIEKTSRDEAAISKAFEDALSRGSTPSLLKIVERVINGKEKGKNLDWAYTTLMMLSKFYCTEDMINKGWMFFSTELYSIKFLYATLHKKLKDSKIPKEQAILETMNKEYECFNKCETLVNELNEMIDLNKIAKISKRDWNLVISTLDFGASTGHLMAQNQLVRLFSTFRELKIHFSWFWEKVKERKIQFLVSSTI
jgi:TPR repeat protein